MPAPKSFLHRVRFPAGALATALVAYFLAYDYCYVFHQRQQPPSKSQWSAKRVENDLVVEEAISWATPFSIYDRYKTQNPRPQRVVLSSSGGDRIGGWLSGLVVWWLGLPTFVSEDALCASSCVSMMLTSGNYTIHPNGYLLFHAGRRSEPAFDDCQPCLFIKETWPQLSTSGRHAMLAWATEIAPPLGAFISRCSRNPLDTHEGLVLSGAQIDAIAKGVNDFTCDDIAVQDANWFLAQSHQGAQAR